jgi:hypothetical protein
MNRTPTRNRNNSNNGSNPPPLRRRRIDSNSSSMNVNVPEVTNNGLSFMERMQQEMRQRNRPRRESWQSSNSNSSGDRESWQGRNNSNINMQNMPSMKERTKTILFEKSPIVEKEHINISVNNPIDVYDFLELDTVSIDPFNLDKNIVVFKATNSYFQYNKSEIESDLDNVENIIFGCVSRKIGAPIIDDIDYDNPYYLLRGSANFAIPLSNIRALLISPYNVFEIKKTDRHLAHTTALESIIDIYPQGLLGQDVDIVSADHCQAGTERDVYELIPIKFEAKKGGKYRKVLSKRKRLLKKMRNTRKK